MRLISCKKDKPYDGMESEHFLLYHSMDSVLIVLAQERIAFRAPNDSSMFILLWSFVLEFGLWCCERIVVVFTSQPNLLHLLLFCHVFYMIAKLTLFLSLLCKMFRA